MSGKNTHSMNREIALRGAIDLMATSPTLRELASADEALKIADKFFLFLEGKPEKKTT